MSSQQPARLHNLQQRLPSVGGQAAIASQQDFVQILLLALAWQGTRTTARAVDQVLVPVDLRIAVRDAAAAMGSAIGLPLQPCKRSLVLGLKIPADGTVVNQIFCGALWVIVASDPGGLIVNDLHALR